MSGSMPIEIAESARGRTWGLAPSAAERTPDADLLDRFIDGRDEVAFETLVRRHGSKVLRTCRRHLGPGQDADDAFQATFLVLVDRADRIRLTDDIGGWLCGVARRVAGRARMRADRRRVREGAAVDVSEIAGREEPDRDDLGPILKAEVDRLPEKYRRPIELCYWEGMSSEQAAERLRCPAGTLKWRLSRARDILRGRLARFGIAMAALLMWRLSGPEAAASAGGRMGPGPLGGGPGEAALPADLVRRTVDLAVFSRDATFRHANRQGLPGASWAGRRKRFLSLATLIVSLAGFLLAIPAASLAVPAVRRLQSSTYAAVFGTAAKRSCQSKVPAAVPPPVAHCSRG